MTQLLFHVITAVLRSNIPSLESRILISGKLIPSKAQHCFSSLSLSFYNKTEYSGLETHILNSYTNAILQVMHHSLPIRQVAKSHIITNCPREHCLLCELGFVVRMLEDAKGINCQSSNFCKTIGVLAQGTQLIKPCCGDNSHSFSAKRDRTY